MLKAIELDACDDLFRSVNFWTAIGAIAATGSVVTAAATVTITERTKKKQETYNAFQKFKNDSYSQELEIEGYDISDILKRYDEIREKEKNSDTKEEQQETVSEEQGEGKHVKEHWTAIKKYLINVEYIATCVNAGVFDIQTIYNMGGPYMIHQYEHLRPIIHYKRMQEGTDGVYEEFENMVKSLRRIDNDRRKHT